jgi:hypothetical protein
MRFKSSRVLLVLVAVFALSAVAAASASAALPEIVNKEGKALVKDKFSVSGDEERFQAVDFHINDVGKIQIYCEKTAVTGKFGGLKTGETTFTLKSCKGDEKCTGVTETGEKRPVGEIVIPFSLTLVYTDKASKELALLFKPPEGLLITCNGTEYRMYGGFLVPIEQDDVNYLLKVGEKLWLNPKWGGGQKPKQYENEKGEKVETYLKISAGTEKEALESEVSFSTSMGAIFEEEVEFKG